MKLENGDDVRQALDRYADTTRTSPDAWDRTLDRAEKGGRRRRIGLSLVALTTAAALIAAGVVWVARPREPLNEQLVNAIDATARERFAFSLVIDGAGTGPVVQPAEGQYDTRRGVGWLRVEPRPMVLLPPDMRQAPPAAIEGPDAIFDQERVFLNSGLVRSTTAVPAGRAWIAVNRDDAEPWLEVVALATARHNLSSVVEAVTAPQQLKWLSDLPTRGSELVAEGAEDVRGVATTRYRIEDGSTAATRTVWIDGQGLIRRIVTLTESSDEAETLYIHLEFYNFGAPPRYDVPPASEVTDGSALELPHPRSDQARAVEGPAEAAPQGDARTGEASSAFSLRPVIRHVDPPCRPGGDSAGVEVLQEVVSGVVAESCYEVGPPGVDGRGVASAHAVRDERTGQWAVNFALTPEGAKQFEALARQVGIGGQIAIVVDGLVVSAPNVETTDFAGPGQITGNFDEGSARELADRLEAG